MKKWIKKKSQNNFVKLDYLFLFYYPFYSFFIQKIKLSYFVKHSNILYNYYNNNNNQWEINLNLKLTKNKRKQKAPRINN